MTANDVSEVQATGVTWGSDGSAVARWERACFLTDLFPERGAAALFGNVQVALFRLPEDPLDPADGGPVYAVQNLDPFSGAYVMSRGIVGTRAGVPTVAAPVYKQVFSLVTGECLVAADKAPQGDLPPDLRTYEVEIRDGVIHVGLP
ncbi:assimilatory nitrite reductase (NAD(P)H) small subunit (EC 1.7.1.4) [Promicromonospora umidemergens]|uniref:Nitrite reductase small subunit NirD n=1 Tax=Promicromonospora umidemergens TaxID=629679 RepID=A0ABP8X2H8_9MICO|nr:nitrite reductase (NAD(P)H) small subunit family protein [Promicromonospora umidemergens]MCP2285024.1 assimilatory nitrite reductase (NAD(P)H) small subunit (EC 1.7.1.4) [Promicromonospora umidemergens]